MPRDVVSHRNRPWHWWASSSAVREKVAWLLKFDLRLPLHVAKELNWRSRTMLSARAQKRDNQSAEQDKADQKILNHARKATSRLRRQSLPRTHESQCRRSADPKPQ